MPSQDRGKIPRPERQLWLVGRFHQAQTFVLDDKPQLAFAQLQGVVAEQFTPQAVHGANIRIFAKSGN